MAQRRVAGLAFVAISVLVLGGLYIAFQRSPQRVATDATRDLNSVVYERIGLPEARRTALVQLLAELRASGHEFNVERSDEVIEEVGSRHARKRGRKGGKSRLDVA